MGESVTTKFDIYERCFNFSKSVIGLSKLIKIDLHNRAILEQLLKSATSVSANLMEASESESKKDFVSKLSISIKETKESLYWLRLLRETGYGHETIEKIFIECSEIVKILGMIKLNVVRKNQNG